MRSRAPQPGCAGELRRRSGVAPTPSAAGTSAGPIGAGNVPRSCARPSSSGSRRSSTSAGAHSFSNRCARHASAA
jgi:hypothetical protein